MQAAWVAGSTTASRASRSASPAPSASSQSSATSSVAYVPVHLRRKRANLKVQAEIAQYEGTLVEHEREAAKHLGPNLPKFELPFFLDKPQMQFLQSRFPRTTFRCKSDNPHDHPLAHTETMIATLKAQRMVAPGQLIVDLYGDPKRADELNRSQARSNNPKRAIAYTALKTEKDYLRALKWGMPHGPNGLRYIEECDGLVQDLGLTKSHLTQVFEHDVAGRDVTWFMRHTMYYSTDEQIAEMLSLDGSRALAIVHRHPNVQDALFNGDCTYWKVQGCVEQVNVLTGERYVHRDLSYLWDSTTKVVRTSKGAYTWTFHMVSADTWIIELVGCPNNMDERFRSRERVIGPAAASHEMNEHSLVPTRFPHPALANLPKATALMVNGIPVIKFTDELLPDMKLTCPPLYEFLAQNMVGKPRDADRLRDLFALARSHLAGGSEFPGRRNFNVPVQDVATHVTLAFISGLENETLLYRAVEAHRTWIKEHDALINGAALVVTGKHETAARTAVNVLKRVNASRKQGDVVSGILSALE